MVVQPQCFPWLPCTLPRCRTTHAACRTYYHIPCLKCVMPITSFLFPVGSRPTKTIRNTQKLASALIVLHDNVGKPQNLTRLPRKADQYASQTVLRIVGLSHTRSNHNQQQANNSCKVYTETSQVTNDVPCATVVNFIHISRSHHRLSLRRYCVMQLCEQSWQAHNSLGHRRSGEYQRHSTSMVPHKQSLSSGSSRALCASLIFQCCISAFQNQYISCYIRCKPRRLQVLDRRGRELSNEPNRVLRPNNGDLMDLSFRFREQACYHLYYSLLTFYWIIL